MANTYFQFKQFIVHQSKCAMKVSTDACIFGAWVGANMSNSKGLLLDIGAGTGLLSLMLAQTTNCEIHAVEIESNCFQQLRENIFRSPWNDRISTLHTDVLNYFPNEHYDLVISNPPFYENHLISPDSSVNLARHSPALSLESLFSKVREIIKKEGDFYLLLPHYRYSECLQVALKHDFHLVNAVNISHSPAHKPFRVMFCFKSTAFEAQNDTIDVLGKDGKYSKRFSQLLSPFYLQFH